MVPASDANGEGAVALCAETSSEVSAWLPAFLQAPAAEAADRRQRLMDRERLPGSAGVTRAKCGGSARRRFG